MSNKDIDQLKKALEISPQNLPLRELYIQRLIEKGANDEAEKELIVIIRSRPKQLKYKHLLAKLYVQQEKVGAALILLEEIIDRPDADHNIFTLFIRLLLDEEKIDKAGEYYRKLIERFPDQRSKLFEERLSRFTPGPATAEKDLGWADDDFDEESAIIEKPDIDFSNVYGLDDIKESIYLKIIAPLKNPDVYNIYGQKAGGGILMFGPPGCGKTYLARATAGEAEIPVISIEINNILDMYYGQSEQRLHEMFEFARDNSPCVLFFDEVDALGASRNDLKSTGGRNLVNQFLTELDGIDHPNDGILVLASTNAPWLLDPAFRRSGRFDRTFFAPPPSERTREELLKMYLDQKYTNNIDIKEIVSLTAHYSGADLKLLVDTATELKIKTSLKTGEHAFLLADDVKAALDIVKPTTIEWLKEAKANANNFSDTRFYEGLIKYLDANPL